MEITKAIALLLAGFVLLIKGADFFVDGSSAVAKKLRVPSLIIGLTIVAAGTSAPELFVSLMSALKGTPDMAVGNVVGSNIFNALLIVGCAAMVAPMVIAPSTVKKDMPFAVGASILLLGAILIGHDVSRLDGKREGFVRRQLRQVDRFGIFCPFLLDFGFQRRVCLVARALFKFRRVKRLRDGSRRQLRHLSRWCAVPLFSARHCVGFGFQ